MRRNTAPMTTLFLVVNVVVFVALHAGSRQLGHALTGASAPRLIAFGALRPPMTDDEPWRLLTASFLHIGLLHLGMNMLALVQVGRDAERLVGPARYALAYVLTGIAGFAVSVAYCHWQHQYVLTAGASASLFGVLGLLLGWLLGRRDPRWRQFATQTALYALLFGFLFPRVNNAAHVGGLVAGVLFGMVYATERHPRRHELIAKLLGGATLAAIALAFVLTRRSPLSRQALEVDRQLQEETTP